MHPARAAVTSGLATGLTLTWLGLSTVFAAAAAPHDPADLGGEPLPGGGASTNPAEPTELAPGLWQATLAPEFPQYFTYERRIKDSRVHVGVLGAPQGDKTDGIRIHAAVEVDGSSTNCGDLYDASEYSVPQALIGIGLVVGEEPASTGEACRGADTVLLDVTRGYGSATTDLPYVIKVVEEAPAAAGPDDEEPDTAPAYDVPEPVTAEEVDGASSLADAPALDARDGAVTVRTILAEGEEMLWKVPLTWGDLPVVRVDVPWAEGADAEAFPYSGPEVTVHLIDPLRSRLRYVASGTDHVSNGQYEAQPDGSTADGAVLVAAGYPVTRVDGRTPGDYWISVAVSPTPEDREAVSFPVEVTVAVATADDATPSHNAAILSQDDSAGPAGYSPDEPFLVADGVFSAAASGNPVTDRADDEAWLTGRRWAGFGVAALSLACLAGGVVRLRARR